MALSDRDRTKLLFGPYQAPPLKNGDRTFCLYRQQAVIITTWSDARTPWPRCYLAEGRARGHGLLVDEELARAIQHESAAAVAHWWGASRSTVQMWRRAFGVGRTDNEGTHRLVEAAVQAGMDSRAAGGRLWTPEETALVGALPDSEVARRTGRSTDAVRRKRLELKQPKIPERRAWTPEETALVGAMSDSEVARRTGRSTNAVWKKRRELERPIIRESRAAPRTRTEREG